MRAKTEAQQARGERQNNGKLLVIHVYYEAWVHIVAIPALLARGC